MRKMFRRMIGWFLVRQSQGASRRQREHSDRQIWDGIVRGNDDPDARRVQEQARGWYTAQEQQRRQRHNGRG